MRARTLNSKSKYGDLMISEESQNILADLMKSIAKNEEDIEIQR